MLRDIFVFAIIAVGGVMSLFSAFNALLFYLWNAYFRPEQWTWNPIVAQLGLSFTIGAYLVVRASVTPGALRINARTALLALFAAQTLLSALLSQAPDYSWAAWLEFGKVLLISYLIIGLVDDRRKLRLAILTVAFSLGFECVKQGWAQLILNPGAQNNNWVPFLGDNNGVALGTMMLVPLFGALAKTAATRWEAGFHRFCLAGAFYRGVSTYSRGGFLAGAVLALIALVQSKHKVRAIAAVAVLATIVAIAMPPRFWARMQTITVSSDQRDESQLGRLHFWHVGLLMANDKPATGIGFAAYESLYNRYNDVVDYGEDRAVHSVWFGLLAELGYPGFLLFVAQLGLAIKACQQIRKVAKQDPQQRDLGYFAEAFGASLIVFVIGGTFLAAQYSEMYWHLIGFSAALHLIARRSAATEVVRVQRRPVSAPAALVQKA